MKKNILLTLVLNCFLVSFTNCDFNKKQSSKLESNLEKENQKENPILESKNEFNDLEKEFTKEEKEAFVTFNNFIKNIDKDKMETKSKNLETFCKEQPTKCLKQISKFEYNESFIKKIFIDVGVNKSKEFLKQLHKTIKEINDGSFRVLNDMTYFKETERTLEEKKKEILDTIKLNLYSALNSYFNNIYTLDDLFERMSDVI